MNLIDLVRHVADGLDVGVLVTNTDLRRPGPTILYANDAFLRMSGYGAADVLGQSPRMLQGAGTSREGTRQVQRALRGDGRFVGRCRTTEGLASLICASSIFVQFMDWMGIWKRSSLSSGKSFAGVVGLRKAERADTGLLSNRVAATSRSSKLRFLLEIAKTDNFRPPSCGCRTGQLPIFKYSKHYQDAALVLAPRRIRPLQ